MRGGTFQEQVATEARQVMSVREVGVVGKGADGELVALKGSVGVHLQRTSWRIDPQWMVCGKSC